jgi:hypothetical protein
VIIAAPALPLDDAGPYVAAAYLVFLALILIYVAIMANKLVRIARDLGEVAELVERRDADRGDEPADEPAGEGRRSRPVQLRPDAEDVHPDAGLEAPRR